MPKILTIDHRSNKRINQKIVLQRTKQCMLIIPNNINDIIESPKKPKIKKEKQTKTQPQQPEYYPQEG